MSSTGTTLASLQLAEGYYRTSNESHVVLECYRKDSCIGGLDPTTYCATGYEGPCECNADERIHNAITSVHCVRVKPF